ncbi:MAG: hypothetical protein P1U87_01185 [Verrucomicrobiales bacterium]|nr:hypothetical protein [Verrucomicrobiales bacterium]
MFRLLAIYFVIFPALLLCAQDGGEFHEFTDKKGSKIYAMLLGVSEDNRMMKIRREDGQEFESEINVLCLDDQQFIKAWMKKKPMLTAGDYRIELSIAKKAGETERRKGNGSSYSYVQRFSSFEVTVQNLSRETLPSTRLEYVILWDDQLVIYQASDGDWTYRAADEEDETIVKVKGEIPLPAIPFNREEIVTTSEFEINQLLLSGDVYREDEPFGIYARVVTDSGVVLAEARVGTSEVDKVGWEDAIAFNDPEKRD